MNDPEILTQCFSDRPVKEITRNHLQQVKLIRLRIVRGYYFEKPRMTKIIDKIYQDIYEKLHRK